jgi:amino acid adenylation domain-containing protein
MRAEINLSCAQQRVWLAAQASREGRGYHLGWMARIDGDLDIAALRAALGEIVARHEVLRGTLLDSATGDVDAGLRLSVAPVMETALPVIQTSAARAEQLARELAGRPFAASTGPLWRAALYQTGPASYRFMFAVHHVIADGTTLVLLFSELAAAYRDVHDGRPPSLPPAVPYRAYCAWEQEFLGSQQCADQVAYWSAQAAGLARLELPTGTPPRPGARGRGGVVSRTIAAQPATGLRQLARTEGCSLAHVMLAGYAAVLHRYSGNDEFAVGLPVSTRHGRRWATSAGLYVNTLPIRVRLAENPPFGQLARQVRDTVLTALSRVDVPLDRVPAGRQPLFDVSFGMTSGGLPRLDLPGLSTRVTPVYAGHAKFDLHLEVIDRGPGSSLRVLLEYDAGLLTRQAARQILASVCSLVTAAAAAPGRPAGELPMHDEGDGIAGNRDADPLPGNGRVDVLFAETAAAVPDQTAVIDAATGAALRYRDLASLTAQIAAELTARGVRRGDFVGITLPRSVELVAAITGVLAAGAAYVPLDAGYPVTRLAEMVKAAGVRLVIGPVPAGLDVAALDLPERDPRVNLAASSDIDSSDPAYVMFTSGSTGQPKAVVVPHQGIVRLVRDSGFARMTADERWLNVSSPSFDGSTLELWAALLNGATLVVLAGPPTVEALGDALSRHQVTAAWLTTGLFNLVVDTDVSVLKPLRQVIVAGEAASAGHVRRALRVVPTVINGYGPSENTSLTTCHVMRSARAVKSPVPIGVPIRGTVVQVVDAYLNPMPTGAVGEILNGGQGLALRYAGAPALTAERFVPSRWGPPGARLYRTGDYGWLDHAGVLHFTGRRDDQVKVRGFRVELGAIEHMLLRHAGVAQVAVTVHTDPSGDRRLIGYVVGKASTPAITRYLRERLPDYMVPGQWVRLDALPLGPTGKVDRRQLPVPPPLAAAAPARPVTAAERALIGWCQELLGLASADLDTDFLAAGGHSLFAVRLLNRIRMEFDVEMSLSTIMGSPRLADLAAVVAASQQSRGLPDP